MGTDAVVKTLTNDNFLGFIDETNKNNKKNWDEQHPLLFKTIEEGKYDLIVCGTMNWYNAFWLPLTHKVPCLMWCLSSFTFDAYKGPAGLPTLPFGLNKPLWQICCSEFIKGERGTKGETLKKLYGLSDALLPSAQDFMDAWNSPAYPFPVICGLDGDLDIIPSDAPPHIVYTGEIFIPAQDQKGAEFGGAQDRELQDFLSKGEPPVYIGWGSMKCGTAKSMTCLALRTLKLAQKRGIILIGWAGLGLEHLEGESDAQELRAFAGSNVLFLKTAAHEVLFPKCSVIVHHGGTGTTASSLRSGRPVIITPIIYDQFANGEKLNKTGTGVPTKQLSSLDDGTLSKLLIDVLNNETMKAKAAELGKRLRSRPNGSQVMVDTINKFLTDKVNTGLWAAEIEKSKEDKLKSASSCNFMCF